MMPDRTKWLLYARNFILTAFAAAFILSCANIARPTGGPTDTTPPVFVKSNPKPNQLNFNKNKIEIEFDEIIQVDKPTEKVIVSPAQTDIGAQSYRRVTRFADTEHHLYNRFLRCHIRQ